MTKVTEMTKKTEAILKLLDERYGTDYRCSLEHKNAWQLLVATILSAQCTDARVNIVTKELFRKYPSVEALAGAELAELERISILPDFTTIRRKTLLPAQKP